MSPPLLDTQDCTPAIGACGGSTNGTGQASVLGARVFPGNLLEAEAPEPSCPGRRGGPPSVLGPRNNAAHRMVENPATLPAPGGHGALVLGWVEGPRRWLQDRAPGGQCLPQGRETVTQMLFNLRDKVAPLLQADRMPLGVISENYLNNVMSQMSALATYVCANC